MLNRQLINDMLRLKVCSLIPAYNEEQVIDSTLDAIFAG
jgi:hypothetical protein